MPDIELLGATYPDVPAVDLPKSGGGTARFYDPSEINYAGSSSSGGTAYSTQSIPYAKVDSTSTSTAFTATVPEITQLVDGTCVLLKNGVVTSASGFTIDINGLGAKPVYNSMAATGRETTIFNVNYTLLLIYDEDRVEGGCWVNYRGYYSDSNYVPTGYCTTAAATAAKAATCTYGYRDDSTYFPCVFRYANTAANATLAISSYATTAAPIYVNGARTSSSNTFGRGVILFLYHNGAYYCYNDGRFPIVVDGAVTSVQEYVAAKYTKPSGGIPKTDLASDVQTSLGKAGTALQADSLKTINGESLVGSGDIQISGGGGNSKIVWYTDKNCTNAFIDQACTETVAEHYGYDYNSIFYDVILPATSVQLYRYERYGVGDLLNLVSVKFDTVDETFVLNFFLPGYNWDASKWKTVSLI